MANKLTLVIGDKNFSSWSLRPWLALKAAGLPFEEEMIRIHQDDSVAQIIKYSPSGRVPALIDGDITVWDSISICEYLAEKQPQLWPTDAKTRAHARSISAEMHAGFAALRQQLPMHCFGAEMSRGHNLDNRVQTDIARIQQIWQHCLRTYGKNSDTLFGSFTIADAMYAPVVIRFKTYGIDLNPTCRKYADAIWNNAWMQQWLAAAQLEA